MKGILKFVRQAGYISLSPLLVSLASIATVPLLVATRGESFWVSVAFGQLVGEIGRAIITWGYNSRIAHVSAMSPEGQLNYYFESIAARLLVGLVAVPIILIVFLNTPLDHVSLGVLMVVGGSIFGLSANWYFIAAEEPGWLILLDSAPRALTLTFAAVSLLFITGETGTVVFGVSVLLGNIVGVLAPYILLRRRSKRMGMVRAKISLRGIWRVLAEGTPALLVTVALTLRLSLPFAVTPTVAPGASASVGLADKILRWINTGATPVMQVMQSRVPRGEGTLESRIRRSMVRTWALGILLGIASVAVIPILADIISLGVVQVDVWTALPIGISLCMIFVSAIIGLAALPLLGRSKSVAFVAFLSLGLTAASIYPLVSTYGAAGAFWALALGEIGAILAQYVTLHRALRVYSPEAKHEATEQVRLAEARDR